MSVEKTPQIDIQNIVSVGKFDTHAGKANLETIRAKAKDEKEIKYVPNRFPAAIMRITTPQTVTALIFSTGKVVITGIKRLEDVEKAADAIYNRIKEAYGNEVTFEKPEIKNITATSEIGFPIKLDAAHLTLENATYEPEVFPGLIYKSSMPKMTFLVFSTGRIVCTGMQRIETAIEGVNKLKDLVKNCRVELLIQPTTTVVTPDIK